MKVYALYHNYYDYCDNWVSLVQLYRSSDDAKIGRLFLEDEPHNKETDSWHVEELVVI